MSVFARLNDAAAAEGLAFLVIGGHAVIEHGFQRATEDADLLVCKDDRARWIQVVESLGYHVLHDGGNFVQFESRDPSEWPLDLMLVAMETFERLRATSQAAKMEGADVSVPNLQHLISLKAHALKHGRGLRVMKDLTDVAELLSANRVDPRADWVKELFEKHGSTESYERVIKLLS